MNVILTRHTYLRGMEMGAVGVVLHRPPLYTFPKRVYGQFSIETIHERRKRNREFSGLFFSVLLTRIGKQNVKIIVK